MSTSRRLALLTLLACAPLPSVRAQNAGKSLAMDFRVTTSVTGMPDTTVMMGHAVGSPGRMRIDVTPTAGPGAQLSPLGSTGTVTMIVSDTGKTITYIDTKLSQYMRVRPLEIVQQAQESGSMKMDISGTQAKVDALGAGPTILGHPTTHYHVATSMTMTMSAKGIVQSMQLSNSGDYYYANDVAGELNPFSSLTGSDMVSMFGTSNKEFADKMSSIARQLPKKTPLRANVLATIVAMGTTRVTTSQADVTSLQWVTADPKQFEIPAGYKPVPSPGSPGAAGAIPPD